MAKNRAAEWRYIWHEYNDKFFSGKLTEPVIKVNDRALSYWGSFAYSWSRHSGKGTPGRRRAITIHGDAHEGDFLHEMIHQYQFEVLEREPSHDAIFNSIARKCERLTGLSVR